MKQNRYNSQNNPARDRKPRSEIRNDDDERGTDRTTGAGKVYRAANLCSDCGKIGWYEPLQPCGGNRDKLKIKKIIRPFVNHKRQRLKFSTWIRSEEDGDTNKASGGDGNIRWWNQFINCWHKQRNGGSRWLSSGWTNKPYQYQGRRRSFDIGKILVKEESTQPGLKGFIYREDELRWE